MSINKLLFTPKFGMRRNGYNIDHDTNEIHTIVVKKHTHASYFRTYNNKIGYTEKKKNEAI